MKGIALDSPAIGSATEPAAVPGASLFTYVSSSVAQVVASWPLSLCGGLVGGLVTVPASIFCSRRLASCCGSGDDDYEDDARRLGLDEKVDLDNERDLYALLSVYGHHFRPYYHQHHHYLPLHVGGGGGGSETGRRPLSACTDDPHPYYYRPEKIYVHTPTHAASSFLKTTTTRPQQQQQQQAQLEQAKKRRVTQPPKQDGVIKVQVDGQDSVCNDDDDDDVEEAQAGTPFLTPASVFQRENIVASRHSDKMEKGLRPDGRVEKQESIDA